MAAIVVLTHRYDAFRHRNYLLQPLFEHWARRGHDLSVIRGMPEAGTADVAIMHVDCSVVPPEYVEYAARFPVVINAGPLDIRKRTISQLLVQPGTSWRGPVIVKSNLNCGGVPEMRHNNMAAARGDPPAHPDRPPFREYRIYRSAADVPDRYWANEDVVVERFVPERDERGYWMRTWVFFGNSERCNRHCSRSPIVKADETIFREPAPVPDDLRELRKRLGFDFGKFDFVMSGNRAILLDANRTPGGNANLTGEYARGAATLAKGIDAFLDSATRRRQPAGAANAP